MAEDMAATGSDPPSLIASVSEDELIVALILLDLRRMVDIVEALPGPKWQTKRKRSCLSEDAPPSPAPSRQRIGERMPQVKAKEEERAASAVSASPDTPLNFPRCESDKKLGRSSRKSFRKKSRGEYIDLIGELTQRGDLLRMEIDKVTEYRNKLAAQNSQLKAIKLQLINSCRMGREEEGGRDQIADRTAEESQYSGTAQVGPFVFPDLNVATSQPLDDVADRRARFAEARRRRRDIMRSKSTATQS